MGKDAVSVSAPVDIILLRKKYREASKHQLFRKIKVPSQREQSSFQIIYVIKFSNIYRKFIEK